MRLKAHWYCLRAVCLFQNRICYHAVSTQYRNLSPMHRSILIVEDETAIADNLAYALSTDGFTPYHVTLGQSALDLLRSAQSPKPALIVLDVGLPDMSGFDVCRRLRQFSDTPVIFLTARGDEIDRIVGLELGADDFGAYAVSR